MTLNFYSRPLFHELFQITRQKHLPKGRALHARIIKTGFLCCPSITTNIVILYANCNFLGEALLQFQEITSKTILSWNSLIAAFSRQKPSFAMSLFKRMHSSSTHGGISPDFSTLGSVFLAASKIADLLGGQQAHCLAYKLGVLLQNVYVGTSLLNFYCKLSLLSDARKMFDEMPDRNSFSWTTMVSGYADQGLAEDALKLFVIVMQDDGIINNKNGDSEFLLTSALSALPGDNGSYVKHGCLIHSLAIKSGLSVFTSVGSALVTMYAKSDDLADALRAFESLSDKNYITWTAMITAYSYAQFFHEVLKLFSSMRFSGFSPSGFTLAAVFNACSDASALEEGKQAHGYVLKSGLDSEIPLVTAMIKMYAKCHCVAYARKGFDDFNDEGDAILWSSMISGYTLNSENENALALYYQMTKKGFYANDVTMASVLKACSVLAALHQGKQIHARVLQSGYGLGIPIGSALISMYAKCGSLEDGIMTFSEMNTSARDVVSWNSMISGLAQNGRGKEAVALFEEMRRSSTRPDHVTFINVLSACSHMGLVDEAKKYYYKTMMSDYNIIPDLEHHACMVDVLCRAGKVEEAREFIENVGSGVVCLWRILLFGCKKFWNLEVGIKAGERVMELDSEESGSYMVLSGMYGKMGREEDVERVWRKMRERGVCKEMGCSWIEVRYGVHVFVVGEMNHPEIWNVREKLNSLYKQMEDERYDVGCIY